LDAINFYEQMAALTEDGDIKKVLLDIAREEKPTWGNFRPYCCALTPNRSRNGARQKRNQGAHRKSNPVAERQPTESPENGGFF